MYVCMWSLLGNHAVFIYQNLSKRSWFNSVLPYLQRLGKCSLVAGQLATCIMCAYEVPEPSTFSRELRILRNIRGSRSLLVSGCLSGGVILLVYHLEMRI